jgi:7-cyano-7-deazaguanine reductase
VTNEIADHLAETLSPRFLRLQARFKVRGGIYTRVIVERRQPGWTPADPITLP